MKSPLTTLCYIEQDGKYLMMHRIKKNHDVNEGKWIGVGGHFELGESPEECLLREVREETGLGLTSWRFRGGKSCPRSNQVLLEAWQHLKKILIYLWLHWVLVVACEIFCCGVQTSL